MDRSNEKKSHLIQDEKKRTQSPTLAINDDIDTHQAIRKTMGETSETSKEKSPFTPVTNLYATHMHPSHALSDHSNKAISTHLEYYRPVGIDSRGTDPSIHP